MTICIEKTSEQAKFFAKCIYTKNGSCNDCIFPNFEKVEFMFGFPTIHVETDKSTEDVEELLKANKVKYLWVSQF